MRWSQRSAIGILLGGVSLLAQTNAPPAEPKWSALSPIEESAGKQVGPLEVLTDTMGIDFNPYLSRVLHDVRQHWYELIPESVGQQRGKVVIEFAILKDGSVAGLRVAGTSGSIAMDRPAYGSITGSNPFPPLPSEFKGPYIGLRFSFYYNWALQVRPRLLNPNQSNQPQTNRLRSHPASLTEAQTLYREGHFDEAAQKYQQILQVQPNSAEAYAGLAHVYLKQKRVRQAHETLSKGLAVADSAPIHAALGEVLFREGKLPEAEAEWLNVLTTGHADARTHLGLARVSVAAMQYNRRRLKSIRPMYSIPMIPIFRLSGFAY